MNNISSLRDKFRSTLKSSDTEEHIDLYFYRPIGFIWALIFKSLHVTPNWVTIISIFFGIAAGILFYTADIRYNMLGVVLLVIANSLDSADGQLARMTKQYSRLGRILDGMAGDLWFISIYISICLRTIRDDMFFNEHPYLMWIITVSAGLCHARQAAIADYFRQFHLIFTKKDFPTEFEKSSTILSEYQAMSWRKFFSKITSGVYYIYTSTQERTTPMMQRLVRKLHGEYPSGTIDGNTSQQLRMATLPLCKWENFMTFNWRSIALLISLSVGQPFWYFIAELTVFNIVLIYTIRKHEKICSSFL